MAKRRFVVIPGNYGGEYIVGKVNREFVKFFADKDESFLIEAVLAWRNSSTLEE